MFELTVLLTKRVKVGRQERDCPHAPSHRSGFARARLGRLRTRTHRSALPGAVTRLERAWERLVAYDAFPQENWTQLRTTNVVASPFATARLRTLAAQRSTKVDNRTALIGRALLVVARSVRRLNAMHPCAAVADSIAFATVSARSARLANVEPPDAIHTLLDTSARCF